MRTEPSDIACALGALAKNLRQTLCPDMSSIAGNAQKKKRRQLGIFHFNLHLFLLPVFIVMLFHSFSEFQSTYGNFDVEAENLHGEYTVDLVLQ